MSQNTPEMIHKQVQLYIRVFFALAALTVVTVGVSYLHLPAAAGIALALFIAFIKGSLVASFFMHLSSERKIVLAILVLSVLFFFVLLLYPSWHHL